MRKIADAGGDAFAVPTNLAKEAEVERMVASTIEHFGRVDMLGEQRRDHVSRRSRSRHEALRPRDERRPARAAAGDPCGHARDEGAARAGAILNISSIAGLNYFPGLMAYGMAKAALEHLTVSAAHQLRPFDVAVNTFRIDVPVASEGFVFNLPDVDHSDWEPSEVAAEGIVWMLEQPPSYTGQNVGMARLRDEQGIMASRAERPHHQQAQIVTDTHLRPV